MTSKESTGGNGFPQADREREPSLVTTALTACVDFETFRKQESTLILLNLGVIAALLLLQVLFQPALVLPSRLIILLFGGRFLMQALELLWLHSTEKPLGWRATCAYAHLSIFVHIGFATLVSMLSNREDSHYTILMVLPVVAAAFRYSLPGVLGVAALAGSLTVAQVWVFYRNLGVSNLTEYFEAATMVLIYFAVGLVVWLLVAQLRREQGKLQATLDELEQARDRLVLEEKLAAIGRLASAIAHEIRNPIAMISSSLSTAKQPGMEPALRDEMFGIAAKEAQRLETFTTDFLAYARTARPNRQPEPIAGILDYTASIARARAAEVGVRIRKSGPGEVVVPMDSFQVQQALLNLVMNAIDAAGEGGEVAIGCATGDELGVLLYVENTGAPVPAETVNHIFEPFFTTKPRGTGLGLAIARNIARAHGGELALLANDPGRVRFGLFLPLDAAPLEEPEAVTSKGMT